MPISDFQRGVLALLKANRSPDSYVAGGTAIQRDQDSIRFSADIDFFHDAELAVASAFQKDQSLLLAAGYSFEVLVAQPDFYRSVIGKSGERMKLEWVRDTAFRYFPAVEDDVLGYRLHDVDLAINKCLALANRAVVRDALDILELDRKVVSLAMMVSAACGKDPGFTPELMIEMIQRHIGFSPHELEAESLARPVDPVRLKKDLLALLQKTRETLKNVPAKMTGCLFVDQKGNVIRDFDKVKAASSKPHRGSVRGSWPRIVD